MENKNNDRTILNLLRELFDVVPEQYIPDEEELQFLEERDKLEQETAWSFEMYVQNYEKLKEYGLDEKLLKQLKWLIIFYLENRRDEFLGSQFYEKFKDHEVIQRAFLEFERKMELKKLR